MKGVNVPMNKPEKKAKKRKTSTNEDTLPVKEENGTAKDAAKEKKPTKKETHGPAKKKVRVKSKLLFFIIFFTPWLDNLSKK